MEFMQKDCDYNISNSFSAMASMGVQTERYWEKVHLFLSGGENYKIVCLLKCSWVDITSLIMDEPVTSLTYQV